MSASGTHKPRKKRGTTPTLARNLATSDIVTVDETSNSILPEFPLVAFLWPARGTTSQWTLLPILLIAVGLFRWSVGLWDYSGYQTPPMHGDYEAQRHWMEITNHLPISDWYFYDLQYWGLDYPPLTAYHSWICGKIGSLFDPTWFALDLSRGLEDPVHKILMRATVIASEYMFYIPAVIIFLRHYSRVYSTGVTSTAVALVAILMQPATLLIDHGHFQYNTVMLGFVVACVSSLFAGRELMACVFFVAAIGFKQMALYYSPVIFAYLLGVCITPRIRFTRLLGIAIVTTLSFALLFLPIIVGSIRDHQQRKGVSHKPLPPLITSYSDSIDTQSPLGIGILQVTQVVHRMFPFARGLFEDKVANFWCSVNVFYKLHKLESILPLPRLSLLCTFLSVLPPSLIIGAAPKRTLLPYALAASAWGFFLFSFQVHEKSVLLPLLPMTMLLGSKHGLSKEYRAWIGWANVLGVWTMYPLLRRDGLRTPYVVVTLLWTFLMGLPPFSASAYYDPEYENVPGRPLRADDLRTPTKVLHWQYFVFMVFWHILNGFIPPPDGKPDLWLVVNACLGAVGFGICYLWCCWKLVLESGLLGRYLDDQATPQESRKAKMK